MVLQIGRISTAVLVLALGVGCSDDPPAVETRVTARQIQSADDLIGGTDPLGGLGDWYMANDLVEVIIDDVQNQNGNAPSGGNLIDFAHRGLDDDQFNWMYPIFLVSQDLPIRYETISSSALGDEARITVNGRVFAANPDPLQSPLTADVAQALTVVTEYKLVHGDPKLYVTTTLTNGSSTTITSSFGGTPISDVILWGTRGPLPFAPYLGRGFTHPELDVRNPINAFGGYYYVAAASDVPPYVSYGVMAPSMKDGLVAGVNTEQLSGLGLRPVGDPLPPGASITYERLILIGQNNTIESIASQAFAVQGQRNPDKIPGLGQAVGRVTGLGGREALLIAQKVTLFGDEPTNSTRARDDGAYTMTLPPGNYRVEAFIGGTMVSSSQITVAVGQSAAVEDLAAPPLATLNYTITADGSALPARLTIRGVAPTTDPMIGPMHSGDASRNIAYSADGAGTVLLPPGTYDVYASRGLEYSLGHAQVTLAAGATESRSFVLSRVVDTSGFVSVDAHVHSGASFDASVTPRTRVLAMAAEGIEVVISTEHDVIIDYGPEVASLGIEGVVATIIGVETTGFVPTPNFPRTIGHSNAWPMEVRPGMARNGAPKDEDLEPGEVYERLRAQAVGTPVIQLNHGRASAVGTVGLGYFTNFDFRPNVQIPVNDDGGLNGFLRRTTLGGTENLDFDCLELQNGANYGGLPTSQQNRDDWLALWKQGFHKTAMANSDSHQVALEISGFPRNFVAYSGNDLAALDVESLDASILGQRVIGTSGAFIQVSSGSAGPGDTVSASGATVDVAVQVDAAPWIAVDEVRVLLNGALVCRITTTGSVNSGGAVCPGAVALNPVDPYGVSGVTRYDATITLPSTSDAFVVIEAGQALPVAADLLLADGVLDTWDIDGDGDAADEELGSLPVEGVPTLASTIVPGHFSWAFSNPLLIDSGGDGYTPPGL